MIILFIAILFAAYWWLAYHKMSYHWWLAVTAATGLFLIISGQLSLLTGLLIAIVLASISSLFINSSLRQRLISGPLLRQFRLAMPPMSKTEEEALSAGTVGWDGELFSGQPDWEKLVAMPRSELNKDEREFIDGPLHELCEMLDDWQITHKDKALSPEVWEAIKKIGLFGMIIPKEHGGLDFSALAHSTIVMKIASRSIAAAVTVMVPNSLGPAKLLLHYGTEKQKKFYLPRLATGQEIPCFALTGPKAGSDAGAIPDTGIICHQTYEGKETLGIRLNWDKRYITLGPIATVLGLAFKLYDPDHLVGEETELGITVALIPTDTPGISIGRRHIPLNIPFQNGPNTGKDVFIPMEWIIGGQDRIGQGWRMLVESLSEGRGISLPALATSGGKIASCYTGAYARIRTQFGQPIGYFEGVEEALAKIAGKTYQMDAGRRLMLTAIDEGERPSVMSAIVKYHLTERHREVINHAMDVQGGSGICLGPSNLIGRAYQGIPISITVEGANILTRSMIIFGQGAMRCHPHVLKEFEAAKIKDFNSACTKFDKAIFGHIGFLINNLAMTSWRGLTRGRGTVTPKDTQTAHYFQQLNWMSSAFALCADVSMMTMGGSLKRKERLSARLGDILSFLYLGSAVLKLHHERGYPADDASLVDWSMDDILYDTQEAFSGLFRNLPNRALAWALRFIVFPTGRPYSAPNDRLEHKVAKVLLSPSASRDRLTADIYHSTNTNEQAGRLEVGLEKVNAAASVEKTVRHATKAGLISGMDLDTRLEHAVDEGIISPLDAKLIAEADKLRSQVIAVDSFDDINPWARDNKEDESMSASNTAVDAA